METESARTNNHFPSVLSCCQQDLCQLHVIPKETFRKIALVRWQRPEEILGHGFLTGFPHTDPKTKLSHKTLVCLRNTLFGSPLALPGANTAGHLSLNPNN